MGISVLLSVKKQAKHKERNKEKELHFMLLFIFYLQIECVLRLI